MILFAFSINDVFGIIDRFNGLLIHVKICILLPWLVWLSWLEHRPVNRKVVGSVPNQRSNLGWGLTPGQGVYGRRPVMLLCHQCFSFSTPTPSSHSLKSNKKMSSSADNTFF